MKRMSDVTDKDREAEAESLAQRIGDLLGQASDPVVAICACALALESLAVQLEQVGRAAGLVPKDRPLLLEQAASQDWKQRCEAALTGLHIYEAVALNAACILAACDFRGTTTASPIKEVKA